MKSILFLRHPAPKIPPGYCYGNTDLEIAEPDKLTQSSAEFDLILSSPLQRCSKAADILFPERRVILDERLKELNFGDWENRKWDDLPKEDLNEWSNNLLNYRPGGSESFQELSDRVTEFLRELLERKEENILILSHAGTMRAALSFIMNISLETVLSFTLGYFHCAEFSMEEKNRLIFWNRDFNEFIKRSY